MCGVLSNGATPHRYLIKTSAPTFRRKLLRWVCFELYSYYDYERESFWLCEQQNQKVLLQDNAAAVSPLGKVPSGMVEGLAGGDDASARIGGVENSFIVTGRPKHTFPSEQQQPREPTNSVSSSCFVPQSHWLLLFWLVCAKEPQHSAAALNSHTEPAIFTRIAPCPSSIDSSLVYKINIKSFLFVGVRATFPRARVPWQLAINKRWWKIVLVSGLVGYSTFTLCPRWYLVVVNEIQFCVGWTGLRLLICKFSIANSRQVLWSSDSLSISGWMNGSGVHWMWI